MSVPRSVAEVLTDHVTLEVEGIDRMYLNVYVPGLQREEGVACFFRFHRGNQFVSSALMDPISKTFIAALEAFARQEKIPVITFRKGQRKDDVAAEQRKKFQKNEGVVFIGKAQEKTPVFRTERRRNEKTGGTYPWLVRSTAMVNHFYVYCVDRDFGPFFLKFSTYFPYNAKLCLNGHEYAKRQLSQKGIGFEALDNGVLSCDAPRRLQAICDGLSAEKIDALLRKWLRLLPHPYEVRDRKAGYRYQISILQAEFSLTQVLDRPVTGRVFFEEVIRENLDMGRPSQVQLIFDRRVNKTRPLPDPSHYGGSDPIPPCRLQEHSNQAVSPGGSRASDRNHHQQYARLRHRQATQEPAGSAAGWLSSQPTSARRPKDFSRLLDWRGCLRSGCAACRGRRPKSFGLAVW